MEEVLLGSQTDIPEPANPAFDAVLAAVLHRAPIVLATIDAAGVFTLFEGAGWAAAGLRPGELVGKSAFTAFHDAPRIGECFRQALRGGDVSERLELGRACYAVHCSPMFDTRGSVAGAIYIGWDVADLLPAEEEQRAGEERLRMMVRHAPVILAALDRDGAFTLYTGAGTAALGRKPGDLVGRSLWELYPGRPDIVESFSQALAGRTATTTLEVNELQFEVQWAPTRDRSGVITGVMAVAVDVTARERSLREAERARAEAARLSLARSDFMAAASHELRTPLTAVVGYAELLLSRWDRTDDGKRRDHVARIVAAAVRQQQMVADLLFLTQVESGTIVAARDRLELAPLVRQAAAPIEAYYLRQRIRMDGPELCVIGDDDRLVQVITRLLDNAAKCSPKGGEIEVTWQAEAGWAVVRVRDHGPGIAAEWHEVIFTRFGRVPGSRNRAGRVGTGLGLYVSRYLAELMDGTLDLEASGATGSVFCLRIPAAPAEQTLP
jgi:PAS domain S-box-containing protein